MEATTIIYQRKESSMTTTTTGPLFEDGPVLEELTAPGSIWRIKDEYVPTYVTQAAAITRKEWADVDRLCRQDSYAISTRNYLRALAGLPALTEQEAWWEHRDHVKTEERDFLNPSYGLPDGVTIPAWTMHTHLSEQVSRIVSETRDFERNANELTLLRTCTICQLEDDTTELRIDPRWHPATPNYPDFRACRPCFRTLDRAIEDQERTTTVNGKSREKTVAAWEIKTR
jgi:hypothetical protein